MLEFLQELFGTGEDGQPKALTYDQLEKAAASAKDIKAVNLASGGYVSKDKFDAKSTELEGVEKQLKDANATIKSYKDMDIDGIKKSVSDWQTKYETDTKTLKDQLAKQERNSARDLYFSRVDFASKAAKAGMMAEFDQKNFQLVDGKFEGADAWLEEQRKSDPASFKQKEEKSRRSRPVLKIRRTDRRRSRPERTPERTLMRTTYSDSISSEFANIRPTTNGGITYGSS